MKRRFLREFQGSEGAALITILAAMVILSTIGAILLSISSVGIFNPIGRNSSARAFYLAESGFRYAALKFQQGEDMMDNINGQTFSVAADQDFTLQFRTYKLEVTGGGGSGTLNTEVSFGFVPEVPSGDSIGYLKIGNIPAQEFSYVDIPDSEGTLINFDKATGNWNASAGEGVRFAALSDGSSVSEGGDLQLQSGTNALEFFPKYNGRFTADDMIYQYKATDTVNDRLLGVTRVDGPWIAPSLNPNEAIVLNDFVEVQSTGSYGQGFFGATRQITYYVPFSEATAGDTFHDTFDDKTHWIEEPDGSSAEGEHEVQEVEGDNALRVTDTSNLDPSDPFNYIESSLIEFDWTTTSLDLASQWSSSGNYLSYDAQVKIMVDSEPAYMNGLSFRLDETGNSYGLSFLKAAHDNTDGILDHFVPQPGRAMVVLWERNGPDWSNWTWLAYQLLPSDNYVLSRVFFQDDMESGDEKWHPEGDWILTTTDYHSPIHCWRDVPQGQNPDGSTRTLESISFDLSDAVAPRLSFWHDYTILRGSSGRVEISTDQGSSWDQLERYRGFSFGWTKEEIDLSDYAGQSDVRIRFNLQASSGNHWEDWYVDDVNVFEGRVDWPTLLVSVNEAASVSFTNGDREVTDGDIVQGQWSGASGTVYGAPVLASGAWSTNDASGDILLRDVSGSFIPNEPLVVSGQPCATADTVNGKQNYIRAYIGDQESHGTPGTNPLDRQRLANPRGGINWPPPDVDDTDASNDYFTLVQWNDNLDPSVTRLGTGNEENAVIRTNTLTTPSGGSFPSTRPEIGLHTWGWGSSNGEPDPGEVPDVYFDDFGLRIEWTGGTGGFAPAIQESAAK